MALSLITRDGAGPTNSSMTSGAFNSTGATALLVIANHRVDFTPTLTDNKGNSANFVLWARDNVSAATTISAYVCKSPTVGSAHTVSMQGGGQGGFYVLVLGGTDANSFNQAPVFYSSFATPVTTATVGPITPDYDNSMLISMVGTDVGGFNPFPWPKSGSPFNIQDYSPNGSDYGRVLALYTQTTKTAASCVWEGYSTSSNSQVSTFASTILRGVVVAVRPGASSGAALSASQGSYALTGQAAVLRAARRLLAAQGSYTLTGRAAALAAGKRMLAGVGSYSLTGQAVGLTYASPFGRLVTKPFKLNGGALRAGLANLTVHVLSVPDLLGVRRFTGQVTDGVTARLEVGHSSILAGSDYAVITCDAAGSTVGAEIITAIL